MRWTDPKDPKDGDQRTVRRFLWTPLWVAGETRWFEMASYTERYFDPPTPPELPANAFWRGWLPIRWEDPKP